MRAAPSASWLLEQEARALLTRLEAVRPFVLQETCVAAAAPSPEAMSGIEEHLIAGRAQVRAEAGRFVGWIRGPGARASAAEQQRRFWLLRMSFQNALSQFDLFSEASRTTGSCSQGWTSRQPRPCTFQADPSTGRLSCARSTADWVGRSDGRGRDFLAAATTRSPSSAYQGTA